MNKPFQSEKDLLSLKRVPFRKMQFCQCGRSTSDAHCPKCGSVSKWGKVTNDLATQFDPLENSYAIAPGYKCRRCGADYNEADECMAPRPKSKKQQGNMRIQARERKGNKLLVIDPTIDTVPIPKGVPVDMELLESVLKKYGKAPVENDMPNPQTPEEEQALETGDGFCHCGADYTDGGKVCMRCGKERKVASPSENKKL